MERTEEMEIPYLHDKGQLSKPVLNIELERKGNKIMKIAVASMQGYRRSMEDAHVISLSLPSVLLLFKYFFIFLIIYFLFYFYVKYYFNDNYLLLLLF